MSVGIIPLITNYTKIKSHCTSVFSHSHWSTATMVFNRKQFCHHQMLRMAWRVAHRPLKTTARISPRSGIQIKKTEREREILQCTSFNEGVGNVGEVLFLHLFSAMECRMEALCGEWGPFLTMNHVMWLPVYPHTWCNINTCYNALLKFAAGSGRVGKGNHMVSRSGSIT